MKKFKFIDHTADIAVEVYGETLEKLFENSAEAWLTSVLEEIPAERKEIKSIELEANSIEELLVDFLNELNYLLLTKKWIYSSPKNLEIIQTKDSYQFKAAIYGEEFSNERYRLKEEIKAVTYHQMKIEKTENYFKTIIVFDI